jgi:hypothetical protein
MLKTKTKKLKKTKQNIIVENGRTAFWAYLSVWSKIKLAAVMMSSLSKNLHLFEANQKKISIKRALK